MKSKNLKNYTSAVWSLTRFPSSALLAFALLGIILRIWNLKNIPYGIDADESVILYWGLQGWLKNQWHFYGPEFTGWETLPGYFYSLADWFFDLPRLGPAILGFSEVALVAVLAKRLGATKTLAFTAATILLLNPWHLFYSRIPGTCFGLAIFWLLIEIYKHRPFTAVFHFLGLSYYTGFRTYSLFQFLFGLKDLKKISLKNNPRIFASLVGVAIFFLVLMLSGNLSSALKRGSYITEINEYPWALGYLNSILIWFIPPIHFFFPKATLLSDREIGFALAESLGPWQTPLGWIFSFCLALGIRLAILQRKTNPIHFQLAAFLIFSSLILGFAASFSHFVYLVPAAVILVAFFLGSLSSPRFKLLLGLGLLESALLSISLLGQLKHQEFSKLQFNAKARVIAETLTNTPPKTTFVLSPHSLIEYRYWSLKKNTFLALAVTSVPSFESWMAFFPSGTEFTFVLEDPDAIVFPDDRTEMQQALNEYNQLVQFIKSRAQIIETKTISSESKTIASILRLKWP